MPANPVVASYVAKAKAYFAKGVALVKAHPAIAAASIVVLVVFFVVL